MSNQINESFTLTITRDSIGTPRATFGVPLILSVNAAWTERLRFYDDLAGVLSDWPSKSPEARAATAIFAQNPHPAQIAIGRAIGKPTQAYALAPVAVLVGNNYAIKVKSQAAADTTVSYMPAADLAIESFDATANTATVTAHGMVTGAGPFRLSNVGGALPAATPSLAVDTNYWLVVGTANTFQLAISKANAIAGSPTVVDLTGTGTGVTTLRRCENDVICAQLVQGLNAIASAPFTAAQVTGSGETDTITITATSAGAWFSIEVLNRALLSCSQSHAEPSPTLASDLAAISVENDAWYGVVTLYNSSAYIAAASAYLEAVSKLYIADTCDTLCVTGAASSGDIMDTSHGHAYDRTAVLFYEAPAAMGAAAWFGQVLPDAPGKDDWKFKLLAGITPSNLTTTERANVRAKKGNAYTIVGSGGQTWEGVLSSGDFIDNTRGDDFIYDDMSKRVYDVFPQARKVPYTNRGAALVENAVSQSLDLATQMGILSDDPAAKYKVSVPKIANVDPAKKANRILPDIKWSATRASSIHGGDITGLIAI